MLANQDLRRAKEAVEDDLLGIPGVIGIDIGFKERNGHKTDVLSIRVFVTKKNPLDELSDGELIPPMVEDYHTDVVETETIRYLQDTGRYNPLVGGISVGICGGLPGPGTLGAIVQDVTTGSLGLLSCWHVLVGKLSRASYASEALKTGLHSASVFVLVVQGPQLSHLARLSSSPRALRTSWAQRRYRIHSRFRSCLLCLHVKGNVS